MRRSATLVGCTVAGALACLALVDARQTPAQTQQSPQTPVFRGEIDVIRLDVSVLDRDRQPIRGLTLEDFSVFEDGKSQRLVAVSEIDASDQDPTPTAWMRLVPRDIATNDLNDLAANGRFIAIVMDDVNVPWDDLDIILAARGIGRYLIDSLGPSDMAAVVFPRDAGLTEDFTLDRRKLLAAVDRFDPREPEWVGPRPMGPGPGGGDMPQRFAPILMRSECQRRQPTVPTLEVVAARLATVPNRRKTIVMVSPGAPVNFGARGGCSQELADRMKDVFRVAQRGNINIYGIDPAGYRGYEKYLLDPVRRGGRPSRVQVSEAGAEGAARLRRDFLQITANNTGGRAVANTDGIEEGIDRVFAEDSSYYLVGYQSSNGAPDGKFRRVEVKVRTPGAVVRTRSGYWAPSEGSLKSAEAKVAPASSDLGLSGLSSPAGLPLRASVVPLAPADSGAGVEVAVVLGVRLPAPGGPIEELLTITRNVYDGDGRAGSPVQEKLTMNLARPPGDELRYDAYQRLTLAPGRHEIRLNAHSRALETSGSVFAEIEVPDFSRAPVTLSGIALGVQPAEGAALPAATAGLLPLVPVSARDFAPDDKVRAFFRVFQGGAADPDPITLRIQVIGVGDRRVVDASETLPASAFGSARVAEHAVDLPLTGLDRGPYLLSLTAVRGSSQTRRDVVYRVR